jgi:hypothetical protein
MVKLFSDYVHWVVIYDTNGGKYSLADLTKGIKTCTNSILDKATIGRNKIIIKLN